MARKRAKSMDQRSFGRSFWTVDAARAPGKLCRPPMASPEPGGMLAFGTCHGFIRGMSVKKGLADLGYVEGKNIRIEYSDAVLDAEYHGLMADLTNRKVDIIVAANVAAAVAAAKATNTIPVVMLAVNDGCVSV